MTKRPSSSANLAREENENLRNQAQKEDGGEVDIYSTSATSSNNVPNFRRIFKYYKLRNPPPDLSKVIDMRTSNGLTGIKCVPFSSRRFVELEENGQFHDLGLRPINEWTVSTFDDRPGLYILNDVIENYAQLKWLNRCLLEYPEPPNITNVSVEGFYEGENVWRTVGNQKLRWVTLGNHYNWSSKEYEKKPRFSLPTELVEIARIFSKLLGLKEMKSDAAIVNYYPEKATLSPHVDRSERDHSCPLISISFGQSAVYLTGGPSLDDPVEALMLHSGDVLVMDGDQRLVYHAVPKIVKAKQFTEEERELAGVDKSILTYANSNRVNITIRQVD